MQVATALWRICINNSSRFASFSKEGGALRLKAVDTWVVMAELEAEGYVSVGKGSPQPWAAGVYGHTELVANFGRVGR